MLDNFVGNTSLLSTNIYFVLFPLQFSVVWFNLKFKSS
jgi:hypothetical protein